MKAAQKPKEPKDAKDPEEPGGWKLRAAEAPLWAAALLLAYLALSSAWWWAGAARYPYGLENGEGWVLASAVELAEGRSPYATLEDYPFVVGNYPPLYLAANAAAIRLWGFSPIYGRVISLAALAASLAMVVLLARRSGAAWLASALGGLYLLAIPGVRFAAVQARVDMTAAALSLAGIAWLAWPADEGRGGVAAPSLLFAASLATKHSMVAAPAAALVWLFWLDRPRALKLLGWTAGLTLAWLAACWALFGSAFFLNIGPYTAAIPWSWTNLERMWTRALGVWYLPALVAAAAFAACALPRGSRRERLVALYALAAAASTVTVAKAGSSILYLMEFTLAGSLALALALGLVLKARRLESPAWRLGACLAVALGLFYLQFPVEGYPVTLRIRQAGALWSQDWEGARKRDELMVGLITKAEGPVLAEEATYLLAAGRPVLLNPFVMKWVAAGGRWDESRLVRDIARHHFALIQLDGFAVPPAGRPMNPTERTLHSITRARFSPQVLRAVDLWYELPGPLKDYPFKKLYFPK